jgi:hypothetical protein
MKSYLKTVDNMGMMILDMQENIKAPPQQAGAKESNRKHKLSDKKLTSQTPSSFT